MPHALVSALWLTGAVTAGVVFAVRMKGYGCTRRRTFGALALIAAGGLLGSHLTTLLVYHPSSLLNNHWLLLRIPESASSLGLFGGTFAGLLVYLCCAGCGRNEGWSTLDSAAFAFPFAWVPLRAGCALAGDHPGVHFGGWLSMRTPNGARLNVGLVELLVIMVVASAFLAWDRRPRRKGSFSCLLLLSYAPSRFLLDMLRYGEIRYRGLTPVQYGCIVAVGLGVGILLSQREPPEERSDRVPSPAEIGRSSLGST